MYTSLRYLMMVIKTLPRVFVMVTVNPITLTNCNILWRVGLLLDNDREISKYTTTASQIRVFYGNNWIQQQKNSVLCAVRAEML
jgi:hypothetical protein